MELMVKCRNDDCRKQFAVGDSAMNFGNGLKAVRVEQRKIREARSPHTIARGESVELLATYFYCPHCSTEHIVQLDDNNSMQLLKDCTEMMKQKLMLARAGKNVTKRMSKRFRKNRNLLTQYRIELMCEYDSREFIEEDGTHFNLKCTSGFIGGEEDEQ